MTTVRLSQQPVGTTPISKMKLNIHAVNVHKGECGLELEATPPVFDSESVLREGITRIRHVGKS